MDEDSPVGVPEWVVTFGDMMSLLLTFFIMLASLSEVKEQEKYQAVVDSVRRQFGHNRSSSGPGWTKPRNAAMANLAISGRVMKYDLWDGVSPASDRGLNERANRQTRLTTDATVIFFAEGSTEINDASRIELDRLAGQFSSRTQSVDIRVFTPLRSGADFTTYEDKWELAYARARLTMNYLVDRLEVDENRIRLSMAGADEPRIEIAISDDFGNSTRRGKPGELR